MNDDAENLFFDRSKTNDPDSGAFIAAVEIAEAADIPRGQSRAGTSSAPEPTLLECIEASWLYNVTSDRSVAWLNASAEAPLAVIELTAYGLPAPADNLAPGEIAFYRVLVSRSSTKPPNAISYGGLFSPGTGVTVSAEPLSRQTLGSNLFGPRGWFSEAFATAYDLHDWRAARGRHSRYGGIAVYDVGQGACHAALSEDCSTPLLYVDFGGGVLGNSKTFPEKALSFCFGADPGVVLSHWDWDHWSSAKRFRVGMDALWLAPPVPEKFVQSAFAAELRKRGRLCVWRDGSCKELRIGPLHLERCSGRTTNDSGIAATIFPSARSRRSCLLPGDADYRHIPSVRSGTAFSRLSITHHGGRLHSHVIPSAKRGAVAVCSVGVGNTYKHPFLDTFDEHVRGGWSTPLTTGVTSPRPSNLMLTWNSAPRIFTGADHGAECSSCTFASGVTVGGRAEAVTA
jgi:hypothetical protein